MAELAEQLAKFQAALQMAGEHDEGRSGSRGDIIGAGDTYDSVTWPVNFELIDDDGEEVIKYHYNGRVRHKHYAAQIETSTDDNNFSGTIVASYTIARKGKLAIINIEFQPSQQRSVGNSIVSRLNSLHGSVI
jgi:hypothetical protein